MPAPPERPQVPAPPESPQVPMSPEHPQVPAPPERQTKSASTSPKDFFLGGGLNGCSRRGRGRGWGRGLRGGPAMVSGIPGSSMATQAVGPGTGATLEAFRPRSLPPERPPLLTSGGGSKCQSCVPMSCVSLPLVSICG